MDETAIRREPVVRKCGMKRGEQRKIPLPKKQVAPIHLFAGYNWRDGRVNGIFFERRNSEGFVQWLEDLMVKSYPREKVVVIVDNGSFHKSKMAKAGISLFEDRLEVCFLPPYGTQLNPIERFWHHLKSQVCGNRLFENLELVKERIESFLEKQNDAEFDDRLAFCK